MSDELECFRKAAELGCPDFKVNEYRRVFFWITEMSIAPMPVYEGMTSDISSRYNRYAAAVCAEWWREQMGNPRSDVRIHDIECLPMIDAARAFGKKYGGA